MPEVKFPIYRAFVSRRAEANSAMIALLAGSRIGDNTLRLTEGSDTLLPEIFPAVPHIRRFNLKTEKAREILNDSDRHVGTVAVPYALAIHEDFMKRSLDWLVDIGMLSNSKRKKASPKTMHESLFDALHTSKPSTSLAMFHLLREMRNAQIHAGGQTGPELMDAIADVSSTCEADWQKVSGRSSSQILVGARVHFVAGDTIAAFATSKRLGREVNAALGSYVSPANWANLAVADYHVAAGASKVPNSSSWIRGFKGYVRTWYPSLGLIEQQLIDAARRAGYWN